MTIPFSANYIHIPVVVTHLVIFLLGIFGIFFAGKALLDGKRKLERSNKEKTLALEKAEKLTVSLVEKNKKISEKSLEISEMFKELQDATTALVEKEKMASIGKMAAGLAHEINTPIGYITSNLKILEEHLSTFVEFIKIETDLLESVKFKEVSENVVTQIGEIRENKDLEYIANDSLDLLDESLDGVGRVSSVVQSFKDFSRVDRADYEFADLNEKMELIISIFEKREGDEQIVIERNFKKLPEILCNVREINHMFMNILVNAMEAIDGEGKITISSEEQDGGIYIKVVDDGEGIDAVNLKQIFDPFFTTRNSSLNTGMGLTISYDIVNKHGGTIVVDSTVEKGTTVEIKLPVQEHD